ncbi:MAG: CoA transferase [Dehalococcoidia bacterium]|nr:CoA transferase [Dehalococcoidia bacterium]MCB9485832.1 CoA transferase [Thermoflexaceae bacterium]
MPGALDGIRVLEFSQIVAGPVIGVLLSDLGAEVVKVEPLEGEARRNAAAVVPNEGKYFMSLNRGKRSLTVDLARPEGRDIIHRLIPTFDIVVCNFRVGVTARLGIDYKSLAPLRPGLIYATVTGFGETGTNATRAGSDIVAQAFTGLMAAEAKVDDFGAPAPITSSTFIDRSSGMAATIGICAALYHRERTGEGQEISVSLVHTGLELLASHVMREPVHDVTVRDPLLQQFTDTRSSGAPYSEIAEIRRSQGPRFASHRLYYGGYHTAQGALVLGALTQHNRDAIRRIIGMDDDTDAPGFDAADPASRRKIEDYRLKIQEILMRRPALEWVDEFVAAGVPASVVHFPEEMSDDPHVLETGIMADLVHPLTGPQRVVGPIIKMSATPTAARIAAPPLGADTRAILADAGFAESEIAALISTHAISTRD